MYYNTSYKKGKKLIFSEQEVQYKEAHRIKVALLPLKDLILTREGEITFEIGRLYSVDFISRIINQRIEKGENKVK